MNASKIFLEQANCSDYSELLDQLRKGGVEELSRQFIKLRPALRAMLAGRLQKKLLNRLDASDVVQETFLRASRNLDGYLADPKSHPFAWLKTLSNQILAELERNQFRQKRSPEVEQHNVGNDQVVEYLTDSLDSASQQMQRDELIESVRSSLQLIPFGDRQIIELRHGETSSFGRIAELLGISMEAAKKRYYRAIDRLRCVFAKHPSGLSSHSSLSS